jgi:hypothetical protein
MIKHWERGNGISNRYRTLIDHIFGPSPRPPALSDEIAALELGRRASATDVGGTTLTGLRMAFDELAVAYPSTPPAMLLVRLREYLAYTTDLLQGRMTLAEHRELLVLSGWLSLLAATCHIDLGQRGPANTRRAVAAQLAAETGHSELGAWCLETRAWQVLTDGDYREAVRLAQAAQTLAPDGSSAHIQATAQEGRALARLHQPAPTLAAIEQVNRLAAGLSMPDRPEHHFRYDPGKVHAYTATTLAWVRDAEAVSYTRTVLAELIQPARGPVRHRRVASARLDLALALAGAGQDEEAHDTALTALTSGVLVPSNYWRAAEVITELHAKRLPAAELTDAYRALTAS